MHNVYVSIHPCRMMFFDRIFFFAVDSLDICIFSFTEIMIVILKFLQNFNSSTSCLSSQTFLLITLQELQNYAIYPLHSFQLFQILGYSCSLKFPPTDFLIVAKSPHFSCILNLSYKNKQRIVVLLCWRMKKKFTIFSVMLFELENIGKNLIISFSFAWKCTKLVKKS